MSRILLESVAELPGRRPLRFAVTSRRSVPLVKLTTVANQPGFFRLSAHGRENTCRTT